MNGNIIFADTAGFLAFLDADDDFHSAAVKKWNFLFEEGFKIITTDYVRLESWSLIQRRLGHQAILCFQDDILPICDIHFVGEAGFQQATAQWRIAHRKNLSLVDLTSFACMHRLNINEALTFDRHFLEQGFKITCSS